MASENEKRETLADIVAELRREVGDGEDTYCGQRIIRSMDGVRVRQYCDRIEAAWKRDEERAVEHATRHAEAVARDNCRDCVHNPNGKNYEGVGNAAAMREALVKCREIALQWQADEADGVAGTTDKPQARSAAEAVIDMEFEINAALSAPPRNCDVGTAEEQSKRFRKYCGSRCMAKCRVYEKCIALGIVNEYNYHKVDCRFIWEQMPYEEQEGAGNERR